jgi:hypothetical protein
MSDWELLKYSMMTTALTALCVLIYEVLNWLCQQADKEDKENKKKDKENKENKPKDKEPI